MDNEMMNFTYQPNSNKVVFGVGTLNQLATEAKQLGFKRPVIICTAGQRDLALASQTLLGSDFVSSVFDQAVMHVPRESISAIRQHVGNNNSDSCICVGGSSTIGLGKAMALEASLPILAVPTTYAGSEMTPIWGITEAGVKVTGRDMQVMPKTVIYDPELTISLPDFISGASGINAIAHCVEALYAENKNPVTSLLAEASIKALSESLPIVVSAPANIDARSKALYGSWLGGTVLGSVGMALHHKLCHTLGGSFSLPHAEVHSVMISYALAYNQDHTPQAVAAIARALGCSNEDVAGSLYDLVKKVGAPTSLAAIGMKEEDLDKATEIAMAKPYYNPRKITQQSIRDLLQQAYHGLRP